MTEFKFNFGDIDSVGALAFLAFASQHQWVKASKFSSFDEIESAYEKQFIRKLNDLRGRAGDALDNSNHGQFTELATLYLAIKEFNMPHYLEFLNPDFHTKWVGRGYAYKVFAQSVRMKKKSIGAPRKNRNADIRKHDFVCYILNQFQSWAYQIYCSWPIDDLYPVTIDIAKIGNISLEQIFVQFNHPQEIKKLYKLLIRTSRVGVLKGLQDVYENKHRNALNFNSPHIWQELNNEAGIYHRGESVQYTGLSKSLTKGRNLRKTGNHPDIESRTRYLPVLEGEWNTDAIFLGQKSLK